MNPPLDAAGDLQTLENRSYDTYKSRLKAAERLAARGQAWNASMYALSSSLAVGGIGMLTDEGLYGAQRDASMAGLAVLALVASLVVGQLNYAVRSRDMQTNYKEVQFVSQRAEYLKKHDPSRESFLRVNKKYEELIRGGENQTVGDYWRGQKKGWTHACCYREWIITAAPYASLLAPVLLLIPLLSLIAA